MTKQNSIVNRPPKEEIFDPFTSKVHPVLAVNTNEGGEIEVTYDPKSTITYMCNLICCNKDISGSIRTEILREELQLNYEYVVVNRALYEQHRDGELAMLLLDMAKRSEVLALKYSALYNGEHNKKLAIDFIYDMHTLKYSGVAINCLKRIIISDKFTDKEHFAELLLFAHGKYLAGAIVIGREWQIERSKIEGDEINKLLITVGLGNLIDKFAKVSGFKIKQDSYLPLFTPIVSLGGMLSNIFGSDEKSKSQDTNEKSLGDKDVISNKKSID